ncbi:hypothetical protein PSACC_03743 [Paramicrosporidium saccamoebae]|uniref:FHA domain-containing protein n=1 Tax=Paramicrosporidium saccamoebae TaxID=1246581 RepID=A0A2H9TFD5_9FUNG|nr:hypothetical protein PSACC_03743 [Paramicrosporidium saccamoebae]
MTSVPLAPELPPRAASLDTLTQMAMLDRTTSLSHILASKTATLNTSTDPVIRSCETLKRSRSGGLSGLLKKLRGSGQSISDPERAARKQARALRRTRSLGAMQILTKDYFKFDVPGEGEGGLLASPISQTTDGIEGLSLKSQEDEYLGSPGSPTLQEILSMQTDLGVLKGQDSSRNSFTEECELVEIPDNVDADKTCDIPLDIQEESQTSSSEPEPHQAKLMDAVMKGFTACLVKKATSAKESKRPSLDGFLADLKKSLPRRYSEQVDFIHRRVSDLVQESTAVIKQRSSQTGSISVPATATGSVSAAETELECSQAGHLYRRSSDPAQESRDRHIVYSLPSPAPSTVDEQLQSVLERYCVIKELAETDPEAPIVNELLQELDEIVCGLGRTPIVDVAESMAHLDFNACGDLLNCQEEILSPVELPQTPLVRDLSHEILALNSPQSVAAPSSDMFSDLVRKPKKTLAFSTSRSMIMSLSRPELGYYGTTNDEEMIEIEDKPNDPLLLQIFENHRSCMQYGRTALPQSFTELQITLARFADDIDLTRDSADPKHLFLIPLNEASVPRWVKPGTRFRIGRNSPWLQGKSRVVSRNHCEVFHDIDCFFICDVGSSSGTFINGIRQAEEEQSCVPRALESGDIVQMGVDFYAESDPLGNLALDFRCVQTLVLLGYPKKATAGTPAETDLVNSQRVANSQSALVSWKQIQKATLKARKFPTRLEGGNLKIYMELGDLVHADGAGMAVVFREDQPAFSAIFNNYKMNWEMAMTDAEGSSTIVLDVLPNSTTAYSVMRELADLGRVTAVTPQKLVINPACSYGHTEELTPFSASVSLEDLTPTSLTATPFYTISGDDATFYILQRSHTDRRQIFLGEATLTTKKSRWGKKGHMLEARLVLPEGHEQLIVLGILLSALFKIENTK